MKLSSNKQKSPSKSVADFNIQLQENSSNTNTEIPIIDDNAKNKMDIGPKNRL